MKPVFIDIMYFRKGFNGLCTVNVVIILTEVKVKVSEITEDENSEKEKKVSRE